MHESENFISKQRMIISPTSTLFIIYSNIATSQYSLNIDTIL